MMIYISIFFFYGYGDHRDLHSFPTRRSSDLAVVHRPAGAGLHRLQRADGARPLRTAGRGGAGARAGRDRPPPRGRSEEHTSELQSRQYLVCRLLLEKKMKALSTVYSSVRTLT